MLACRAIPGCLRPVERLWQSVRTTFVLEYVHPPPPTTNADRIQRSPLELQKYQKYRVIEVEDQKPAGRLKVILLEDVEGVGNQFDVVDVNRKLARTDLLLTRKAVYASPFDLEYYGKLREKMAAELGSRVRVPYELLVLGRELMAKAVPIYVSMDNPWQMNPTIMKCALLLAGIDILDAAIYLSPNILTGPNFELEARLIRFYLVLSKQYIVPMLGRISHVSSDEAKQILHPQRSATSLEAELSKYGLREEKPYFHKTPEITNEFDVYDFMQGRNIAS